MKKELASACLVSAVALGMTVSASAAGNPKWAKKGVAVAKCKGVAKMGQNDCGANGHTCAGKAAVDNDPNEWVYVPAGVCEKLAGGVVWQDKDKKKEKKKEKKK